MGNSCLEPKWTHGNAQSFYPDGFNQDKLSDTLLWECKMRTYHVFREAFVLTSKDFPKNLWTLEVSRYKCVCRTKRIDSYIKLYVPLQGRVQHLKMALSRMFRFCLKPLEYVVTSSRCREAWGVGSRRGHRRRWPSTDPSWSKWPCAGKGGRGWWRWWHGREPRALCTWAPQWTVAQVQNTLGLLSVAAVLLLGPLQALKVGICRGGAGRYRCHSIEPWENIIRYFQGQSPM